nr:type VII secretion protein EccCa [Kineosporia sp. A_224]
MPISFRRPPRARVPEPPTTEMTLQPPPTLPRSGGNQGATQLLFMLPMLLGMGAMSFIYMGRGSANGGAGGGTTTVFALLFGAVMIGTVVMSLGRGGMAKKAAINDERRDYQRYLATVRKQVGKVAAAQRSAQLFRNPEPGGLWAIAVSSRLWERRRPDPDFAQVYVGSGPQRLSAPLKVPQTAPVDELDPVSSTALRSFIRAHATVPDLPVVLSLRSYPRVRVSASRADGLDLARAMVSSLVTFHSPDDLRVALCVSDVAAPDWDWAKWLPHAGLPKRWDAAGPVRMVADSLVRLEEMLDDELAARPRHLGPSVDGFDAAHLVVVVDGGSWSPAARLASEGGVQGVTVVLLDPEQDPARPAESSALRLVVEDDHLGIHTRAGVRLVGRPGRMGGEEAETLARLMSSLYTPGSQANGAGPTAFGLTELLAIGDVRTIDLDELWKPRSPRDRLRIPIGVGQSGERVEMDFKESAEEGMGPHGLVIGATGSGKSELLRTLVCGLALTHSSETLNFVLVDFKGGATFAGLNELPHTAAVITNLADDLTLVDRMQDALHGELVRRQEVLRDAGNIASVRDYERAREAGRELEPLPTLMVIIDEFSELLTSKPEFIELFVMIGRLGRSLAVHLLLASQRLEEGRLRGLDSHLSYRVGLRTFSAAESRAVLGVPDAAELPPVPGVAYLKYDTTGLTRFKAGYVSGGVPRAAGSPAPAPRRGRPVVPFSLGPAGPVVAGPGPVAAADAGSELTRPAPPDEDTVLDVLVRQMVGKGRPPHQVWLPPLAEPASLDTILPPLAVTPERGLHPVGWPGNGQLTVPIGIVDRPFEQRRDLLWAQLAGAAGHMVVVGSPQSGKSTLLRSLVGAMALSHTPAEVQFYCLDFGGGTLAGLEGLPHVGGVAGRREAEMVSRLVAEMTTLLDSRERLFAEQRIDSMATFRNRRAQGLREERPFGDVFLVVDGWMVLRQEYEALEDAVTALAARGLGYGIHVVLAVNRWMEVRPALRDLIGTRFELRLGDPGDSEIDRRTAANVPEGVPGRGLTREKLHFLGALPRVDGGGTTGDLTGAVAAFADAVAAAWTGAPAPPVRLLPRLVTVEDLPPLRPEPRPGELRVPLGLDEATLATIDLDLAEDPHFLAFADAESGKSALLRSLLRGIVAGQTPDRARLLVVDYRRSLLGEVPESHLIGYAGSEPVLSDLMAKAAVTLRGRIPGPDVTPDQLRTRSWWTGPELYVVVDDYDLVSGSARNPLAGLVEFLPQAKDIGLHLLLTRRSGGAGRALYEPVLQRLRELGSPGLVMSGSKDEGVLLGTVKPSPQPPGRGLLVSRRHGTRLVQVGWSAPSTG